MKRSSLNRWMWSLVFLAGTGIVVVAAMLAVQAGYIADETGQGGNVIPYAVAALAGVAVAILGLWGVLTPHALSVGSHHHAGFTDAADGSRGSHTPQ